MVSYAFAACVAHHIGTLQGLHFEPIVTALQSIKRTLGQAFTHIGHLHPFKIRHAYTDERHV